MDSIYLICGQRMPHTVDRIPRYIVEKNDLKSSLPIAYKRCCIVIM